MSETVVIVDDHGGFRACARQLLEAEGFKVIGEAADAASGVAVVGDLHPDIVLLDVQLPDTDGVQAARSIAALKGSSAIVLISSRDVSDLLGADVETPARGFIPKWELSGPSIRELLV